MKHFSLIEFQRSSKAQKLGIDNSIPSQYVSHIYELADTILDPLCEAWGSNIIVSSGFRCERLNRAIGGSTTSAHSYAYAADLVPENGKIVEFKNFVMNWLKATGMSFDQYIDEQTSTSQWVHLAVRNGQGQQRKQYLLFKNNTYTSINPATYKATGGSQSSIDVAHPGELLSGTSVYSYEVDKEAIKNNGIFSKTSSKNPEIDQETNKYVVNDDYLEEIDERVADDLEDINDIPKEEDAALTNLLTSIESSDVTNVKGIKLSSDGSYAVKQSKTLRQLMKLFQQWVETVDAIKAACDSIKEREEATANYSGDFQKLLKSSNITSKVEEDGSLTIDFKATIDSAFDKLGHALHYGAICPVCGRRIKYLPPGCYCSVQCMLYDITKKIAKFLMTPNDRYKEEIEIIQRIVKILDLASMTINAITLIPDIIKELAQIPEKYKQYVLLKINEKFCELQIIVQKLMIRKNKLLTKFFKKISWGVIAKPIAAINAAILAIKESLEAADLAFNTWYTATMASLNALKVTGLQIDAESFGWMLTPRSFLSPLPYTAPDATKIFINLPGGNAMGAIEAIKAVMPSALTNINLTALDAIIQAAFPPLTPVDYYLEPALFEIRYLFSDQSDLVSQIRQQLEDILRGGPDYIPRFENLLPVKKYTKTIGGKTLELWLPNIGYLWFLMGLADAWAPHSKALVGSILNPAI